MDIADDLELVRRSSRCCACYTALLLAAIALTITACGSYEEPDLIVYNATVLTVDKDQTSAQAFAVKDGMFEAVGNNKEIKKLAGPNTELKDARGQTVVPGFNDSHLHALLVPPNTIDVSQTQSIDELINLLKQETDAIKPGEWLIALGYDDTALGRHLRRDDLDRVSMHIPILVFHGSLHLSAVNSLALNNANINAASNDPDGGAFYRDEDGTPTGLLSERPAMEMLFVDSQPSFFPDDLSSATTLLRAFYQKALAAGITSYGDALVPPELALAYWWSQPQDAGVRVNIMFDVEGLNAATYLRAVNRFLASVKLALFDGTWLRANTVKLFHGHSLSGRTARLFDEYEDRPGYFGETPQRDQNELDRLIADIHKRGFQAAIHANGDYEIDMALTAIERAIHSAPRDHRHRLEHASIVNDDLLKRSHKLNIVMAPHSYIFEKGPMIEAYGEARWERMFANASIFEYGIPNAANSDFPVSALSPMLRIQSLLTRTSKAGKTYGVSQKLSVDQALYAYTMGGAFATFEEAVKGSITPGKYADFVFLSHNPHKVAANKVNSISVEATYSAGVLRYQHSSR